MDCRLDSLYRQMNGRLESQCKDTKNKSMAEKKSAISYESIMKSLKAREFAPVYILMGDEPFYIDKICDYISETVLQPEERDFIGLDICLAIMDVLYKETGDSKYRACPLIRKMVRGGNLGCKSGKGFYVYNADRTKTPVDEL